MAKYNLLLRIIVFFKKKTKTCVYICIFGFLLFVGVGVYLKGVYENGQKGGFFFFLRTVALPFPGDLLNVLPVLYCLNDMTTLLSIFYHLQVLLFIPYRQKN